MRKFGLFTAAFVMAAFMAASAWAIHPGSLPADKTVLASNKDVKTSPETATNLFGLSYKLSSSGDIIVSLHMECKIVTVTKVKGKGDKTMTDTDSERGFARVWIRVESHDDSDNFIVLNTDQFSAESDPNKLVNEKAVNAGAVTMCDRAQTLSITNTDQEEEISLKLSTLQAHGFTWWGKDIAKTDGALNYKLGNVVNIFVVAQVFGEDGGIAQVRKRVLQVETAHFANQANN